ncbi:TVP38/TMEM64 family protein [Micromonospora sp. URMC 103]|uniref:TVP38/TMEM64 family protein n=1 Tax=Micromonospora sp. URMC 103 TaxID=3423406 RepID=UPI003F19B7D3
MTTPRRPGYLIVLAGVPAAMLAVFALVEAYDVPLLTDPSPLLRTAGPAAAAAALALLLVDVAMPVPSSLIMVANGALFGVVPGALLSTAGGLGATLVAFAVGRRGRGTLALLTTAAQRARAEALLARYGLLAVCLTRPVPVLAETVAVLAGTSRLGWGRVALAGAAGVLPTAFLFAAAGAAGETAGHGLALLALLGLSAVCAWVLGRRVTAGGPRRGRGRSARARRVAASSRSARATVRRRTP